MARICRRAVGTDRRPSRVSGRAVVGAEGVVAGLAKAAERAEPERGVVTVMPFDVIRDRRWRDATRLKADAAQRLDHELMTASALPACAAIPAMNFGTMRHGSEPHLPIEQFCAFAAPVRH
jgi:hypothetical protein